MAATSDSTILQRCVKLHGDHVIGIILAHITSPNRQWQVCISAKLESQIGFTVQGKRLVVERFFAWIDLPNAWSNMAQPHLASERTYVCGLGYTAATKASS